MTMNKNVLIDKGEALLKKLSREHRQIRRAYKIKEIDNMQVAAKLIAATQVLNDRIATDAVVIALQGPHSALSDDERRDRKQRLDELKALVSLSRNMDAISKGIVLDENGNVNTIIDAEEEKYALLDEVKSEFAIYDNDLSSEIHEVAECKDNEQKN